MKRSLLSLAVVTAALLSSCAHADTYVSPYNAQHVDKYGNVYGSELDVCRASARANGGYSPYCRRVEQAEVIYQRNRAAGDKAERERIAQENSPEGLKYSAYRRDLAGALDAMEREELQKKEARDTEAFGQWTATDKAIALAKSNQKYDQDRAKWRIVIKQALTDKYYPSSGFAQASYK